jgi:hypothetical protein
MGLTETLRSIIWEQESYPAYEDFTILPFFALFFPSVRFFLDRFIFQVLSHIYIYIYTSSELDVLRKESESDERAAERKMIEK